MRYALARPADKPLLWLALAAAVIALTLVIASLASSPADSASAADDCRLWTPTPTVSPTPTPTPPFTPFSQATLCNRTGVAANDLHVLLANPAVNVQPLISVPPACGAPTYEYAGPVPPTYTGVHITWPSACVVPGEAVTVSFNANCTTPQPGCNQPGIVCSYWTLNGTLVPSETPPFTPVPIQNQCAAPFTANPPTPPPGIGGAVDIVTSSPTESSGANLLLWGLLAGVLVLAVAAVVAYRRASR